MANDKTIIVLEGGIQFVSDESLDDIMARLKDFMAKGAVGDALFNVRFGEEYAQVRYKAVLFMAPYREGALQLVRPQPNIRLP